jgi:branched-chain amino acid transport system substrate-binding protein
MKTVRPAAAALLAAVILALPGVVIAAEFKIGAVFAVTGPAAALGELEKKTAEMLEAQVNKAGGINGAPVKLVLYDTESDPTKAVMAVKKLIESDKVDVIIGPTTSGESLAMIEPVEKAEIPNVSCAASIKIVQPVRKWVFKTPQSDVMAVEHIYDRLKQEGKTKVAIICDTTAFGESGRVELQRLAASYGLTLVADERFGDKDTDTTAQLTKIKGTDAQALVCWGANLPGPAVVARNRKQLGITTPIYFSHGVANFKFIQNAGDAAEGVFFPAGKLLVADQLSDNDPQKKVLVQYKTDFESAFKDSVNTFGGHAYDAFYIAVNACKAIPSGKFSKAALRDEIEKVKGFVGTGGVFTMSPTEHNGLAAGCFVTVTVSGGAFKLAK